MPNVDEKAVLAAANSGEVIGQDVRGNRRQRVLVGDIVLILIVDPARELVVTLWKER